MSNAKMKWKLGWVPDVPDARDFEYKAPLRLKAMKLPPQVDLRKKMPPVFNQGALGSCTANALTAAVEYGKKLQKQKKVERLSRLFLYYNERVMMGTEKIDSGAYLRDGIKSLNKQGVCPEKEWKYDPSTAPKSKFTQKPPASCYKSALKNTITAYYRVTGNMLRIRECLAEGYPIAFGFAVYDSFYSDEVTKTGIMPMPNTSKETMHGGHAVLAVGYDDEKEMVLVRNSWGRKWGDKGYFWMPYKFISNNNFCDDFWTIREVE